MRSTSPLIVPFAATLLLLAGCSQKAEDAAADASAVSGAAPGAGAGAEMAASSDDAPGLTTSAAPGVAFRYDYDFTLPTKAVSRVQRQHAAACERLGPEQCQVTGVAYEQKNEDEASARLDLLLAPEAAQRFGGDAIAAVERADGSVKTAQVQGENAGGAIEDSQRQSAALRAGLARIEKRLQIKGLAADERHELLRRADEMRGQLGEQRQLRGAKEAALAMTPVTLNYASEGLFGGSGNPFTKAAAASVGSFGSLFSVLLTLAGIALPWLLVAAVIVLVVRLRRMQRRLAKTAAPIDASAAGPTGG